MYIFQNIVIQCTGRRYNFNFYLLPQLTSLRAVRKVIAANSVFYLVLCVDLPCQSTPYQPTGLRRERQQVSAPAYCYQEHLKTEPNTGENTKKEKKAAG